MAKRNTFGVDETLESTFSWEMIRRCFVYIRREGRLFLRAFVLQALAMVAGLCGPLFSARVLDEAVPAGNIPHGAGLLRAHAGVYRRQHSVHHIVQPVRQRHRPEHRP